jgi:hypothetical protein
MQKKKCTTCSEYKNCRDSFSSWIFFIIGLIATVAIRVVTVLIHVDPVYGKIAWYIGVGGFLAFFIYKFRVTQTRSKLIQQRNLVDKVSGQKQFTDEDYNLLGAILCALSSNKETINYFFIFVLSAAALILAVYMDFLK